jgi:rsbT co-antagonist protein RsbR
MTTSMHHRYNNGNGNGNGNGKQHDTAHSSPHTLRIENSLYRSVIDNFPNGAIILFDRELRYLIAGGAGLEAAGLQRDIMQGKTIWDIFPPETCADIEPGYRATLAGAQSSAEVLFDNKVYMVHSYPVRDDYEQIVAGVMVTQNITAQKEAEEALRRAHARTERILESMTNAFFALDREWRFTYVNRHAEGMLMRSREELLGQNVWEEFADAVGSTFYHKYHQAMTTGETLVFEEYYPPLEGWFEVHAVPSEEGLSVYFHDISDYKRTQEYLARISKAVESTSDAIGLADLQGNSIYHNQAFINLFGYTPEEINALGGPTAVYADPQVAAEVFASIQQGQSWNGEVEMKARDGRSILALVRADLVIDESGAPVGLIGACTDISERKRAEQERLELREQVIQSQKALLRELSTPLIPLNERVVVMPLVGSVDTQRAQQVMETLLQGIEEQQTPFAILDITGVPTVDTQVANALIQAARAVKLLGAKVIITGIRPDIAQTLVNLGVSLGDIVTRGTLQAGIAYAMR